MTATVRITGPVGPISGPVQVDIVFSEAVTGLTLEDLAVAGGTASELTGSGAEYAVTITPTASGAVSVDLPAGAASAAGTETLDWATGADLAATLGGRWSYETFAPGSQSGGWQYDAGGSTGSAQTGPSPSNTLAFVHTETSGSPSTPQARSERGILTMLGAEGSPGRPWLEGSGRRVFLTVCIQGDFGSESSDGEGEGLAVEHRATDADAWTTARLIRGWPYATTGRGAGDVVVWRCPSSEGWPGTIVGATRSHDAADALEGTPTYRWSDLTTWGAWESWGLGTGNGGARSISYATEAVDLGASLSVSLRWEATTVGAVALDYRVAATEAALAAADWTDYEPNALVTGRWLQLRWTLTGDGTVALYLDHLCWSAHAPTSEVRHFDADTADWAGSAAAGRQIPAAALAVVTDVQVTLQDVGAGATWELVSKSPPTIRIYNGAGAAIDATVDAIVRGVRAT